MLHLTLLRDRFTEKSTTGVLLADGEYLCLTLEDRIRAPGVKVLGKTCIPAGTYEIKRTQSKRFGRIMPQLMNVPGFEGVRIHSGNTSEHTEGCLLVGFSRGVDEVTLSRLAFAAVEKELYRAEQLVQPIQIEIINVRPPEALTRE